MSRSIGNHGLNNSEERGNSGRVTPTLTRFTAGDAAKMVARPFLLIENLKARRRAAAW